MSIQRLTGCCLWPGNTAPASTTDAEAKGYASPGAPRLMACKASRQKRVFVSPSKLLSVVTECWRVRGKWAYARLVLWVFGEAHSLENVAAKSLALKVPWRAIRGWSTCHGMRVIDWAAGRRPSLLIWKVITVEGGAATTTTKRIWSMLRGNAGRCRCTTRPQCRQRHARPLPSPAWRRG